MPGFRLFTNQMEITDVTVKANFLKHSAAMFPSLYVIDPTEKIIFVASDTAEFGAPAPQYSVVKKGNQYLFYSPQMVLVYKDEELIWDMQKHRAPRLTANSWPGYAYITQEVRVGYGDTKQMQLPYLQYYWIKSDTTVKRRTTGFLFNELDESIGPKVLRADTLAVKAGSTNILVQ